MDYMNLFGGEPGPLEEIEEIARDAWENSDPQEIERREWNRLVNKIKDLVDKLDYAEYWQYGEDEFLSFKVPPTNGGPSFDLTVAGLNDAIAWLEKCTLEKS